MPEKSGFILWMRRIAGRVVPVRVKYYLLRRIPDVTAALSRLLEGTLSLWDEDPEFLRAYRTVEKHTLLDKRKAYLLYQLSRQCCALPGAFAELGVYQGGGAKLMNTAVDSSKDFYVFDTFRGLPKINTAEDAYWKEGDMSDTNADDVRRFLNEPSFRFCIGVFPQTAELARDQRFALVHVDVDIFQSNAEACNFFYPRLVESGVLLFDDYGFIPCRGVRRAVDEFFADKRETPIYLSSGQCMIVKLGSGCPV
jgi:O-methyltransferase